MTGIILKRMAWGLVVLVLVAIITFILSRVVPADPAAFLAGQNATDEAVAQIRAEQGLDRPVVEQFITYAKGLAQGDLGQSIRTKRPVGQDMAQFLPATLELMIVSFVIYLVLSMALAIASVRHPGGVVDNVVRLLTMLGTGVPVFWLGMALQFIFYFKLQWLPLGDRFPIREIAPPDVTGFLLIDSLIAINGAAFITSLQHLALPVFTVVLNLLAVGTRMSRAALLAEQDRLYVRTARGKGLGSRQVLFGHMLRNALSPILTGTTIQFGYLLSWIILVEVIFSWPGIGLYAFQSFRVFDYSPVIALALVSTFGFVVLNLIADLLYPLIDPRIEKVSA